MGTHWHSGFAPLVALSMFASVDLQSPIRRANKEQGTQASPVSSATELREQALGLRWNYSETQDEMGRGTIKWAIVRSVNEVTFDFPYDGAQSAILSIRHHPLYGEHVILGIERGQFLSGPGYTVAVRFDDGRIQTFKAARPKSGLESAVFVTNSRRIIAQLRKAHTVRIEAEFFHEGSRVFEFNVVGLRW